MGFIRKILRGAAQIWITQIVLYYILLIYYTLSLILYMGGVINYD